MLFCQQRRWTHRLNDRTNPLERLFFMNVISRNRAPTVILDATGALYYYGEQIFTR